MLLSLRENGLTSVLKEVTGFSRPVPPSPSFSGLPSCRALLSSILLPSCLSIAWKPVRQASRKSENCSNISQKVLSRYLPCFTKLVTFFIKLSHNLQQFSHMLVTILGKIVTLCHFKTSFQKFGPLWQSEGM